MTDTLICIVCKRQLDQAFRDSDNVPYGGVVFNARGNYGSTVYDPFSQDESLEINVCDMCLLEAAANGAVLHVRRSRPASPNITYTKWTPNETRNH